MRRSACAAVLVVAGALGAADGPPPVCAVVLGIAQDAGVPHIGCQQERCVEARRDPARRERVAALGLIDDRAGRRFVIDATPDLAAQLESLNTGRTLDDRRRPVDGILLTHAHIGHYTGLMYLGREALGAQGVPIYATPRMCAFLRDNGPWSQLVALGNVVLHETPPGEPLQLTPALRATSLRVPHRDEFSDTVAWKIEGPNRSLLFLPDIDKWERWERDVAEEVRGVDVALLDGTFASADEIPGRNLEQIPHPLVAETTALLAPLAGRVLFIHLNHTNALLWDAEARRALEAQGFRVARDGQELPL